MEKKRKKAIKMPKISENKEYTYTEKKVYPKKEIFGIIYGNQDFPEVYNMKFNHDSEEVLYNSENFV